MGNTYSAFETAVFVWTVIFAVGLVVWLAYLQYRKIKRRRTHRRYRAHQAIKRSGGARREHPHSHNHQS